MIPPPTTSRPLGDVLELERVGRVHHARVVGREAGQLHRARAGGDDRVLERDRRRRAVGRADGEQVRAGEARVAAHDAHVALLGHPGHAAHEARDDVVLPRPQRVDVDLRRPERHAVPAHLLRLDDDLRRVQERLGRDAPDVQAHPAERLVALDHDDVEAEVGRAERGGVPARTGAEDEHAGVDVAALALVGGRPHAGRAPGATAASGRRGASIAAAVRRPGSVAGDLDHARTLPRRPCRRP
jgi:hypothetical protein